jgi:hypothetical protein
MDPSFLFAYQHALLADERRLAAYREAIARVVRPGHVVVDLGAGVGVLSIYAARAGAARIHAIDRSVPVAHLRAVLEQNGIADRVRIHHADSREVELPEKCDVLIAEIGLDEEVLLDGRRRFLGSGGVTIPERVTFWMAPVHAPDAYERLVGFWQGTRADIHVSALRRFAASQVHRMSLEGLVPVAEPASILSIQPAHDDAAILTGAGQFTLRSNDVIHGFAGWHRTHLTEGLTHDNAPPGPTGGGAHHFFPLERPFAAAAGSRVDLGVSKRGAVWIWRGICGENRFDQSTFVNLPLLNDGS